MCEIKSRMNNYQTSLNFCKYDRSQKLQTESVDNYCSKTGISSTEIEFKTDLDIQQIAKRQQRMKQGKI